MIFTYIDNFGNITYLDEYGNEIVTFYMEDYNLPSDIISYHYHNLCCDENFESDDDEIYAYKYKICEICGKRELNEVDLIKHKINLHKQF